MLPPQLPSTARRYSLSSTSTILHQASTVSLLRASTSHVQSRSFWGWRRRCDQDYSSHIDPLYHRFTRYRTLKTRAKLLEKLKRRGRFEWDVNQKPFFTPKHIRFASHWNGRSWQLGKDGSKPPKQDRDAREEDGGEVLSQREKEWKDRMEFMRKRIQSDPYEAIFGKRFEPFWSPLVPSWMREEMGLQGWPKKVMKDEILKAATGGPTPIPRTAAKPSSTAPIENRFEGLKPPADLGVRADKIQREPMGIKKFTMLKEEPETSTSTSTSKDRPYSSLTTTSWDSWTNKARRTEWDSASGQTKRFEYDPVSNRMVQVEGPKPTEVAGPVKAAPTVGVLAPASATKRPSDMRSLINTPATLENKALQIPVKTWSPVVVPRSGPSAKAASVVANSEEAKPTASAKPAVLAKLPKSDLDLLTADDVRASMGKLKPTQIPKAATQAEKAAMERGFDDNVTATDAETDAILLERELAKFERPAETKREPLQTSLDRAKKSTAHLQPAVERMQSKDLAELDDSAAHESTEALELSSTVPSGWSKQADILQADRIKRTAGTTKKSLPVMSRWIDDMNAAKAAYKASKAPSPAEQAAAEAERVKLAKANGMLEAEVKEQKFRMQAFEGRYVHKIRSLRQELETAYRQSAVHSGKHVERIRWLEAELAKADKAVGGGASEGHKAAALKEVGEDTAADWKALQGEGDFCSNVIKYAGSEKWYKQPAVHAQAQPKPNKYEAEKTAQKSRDQALVKEVREIYETAYGAIQADHQQRALTQNSLVDPNPFAPGRKPAQVVEVESDVDLGDALAEHEQKEAYGYKKDGLEAELAAKAKAAREAEASAREKEAHEAQALTAPEALPQRKIVKVVGKRPKKGWVEEGEVPASLPGVNIVDDAAPKLIPTSLARNETKKGTEYVPAGSVVAADSGVQWADPPLYKVLAYDSGNDMMSTATTTSNFTASESPISIPEALSRLYQPARFVPHFAELQRDGYQVIYGTRDLLVFKKVKVAVAADTTRSATELPEPSLVDHGLVKPKENELAQEAANFYDRYPPAPKVYDPTSIENGKLMPYENAMAQEAAHAYDNARAAVGVNPIDGTTKPAAKTTEVSTGNFASPTGFVNHDPLFPTTTSKLEENDSTTTTSTTKNGRSSARRNEDEDHSRSVRRQEVHFTGTKRKWSDRHDRHNRRYNEQQEHRRSSSGGRRRGALKWALSVGLGAAGLTYVIGVAAEAARQEKVRKERWEEILEGRRGRWE